MRGSEDPALPTTPAPTGVSWLAKKMSVVTSRIPSGVPASLSNERMRPLTATMNCDGPTAPIESGGMNPESLVLAPRKLVDALCAIVGAMLPAGICGVCRVGELGSTPGLGWRGSDARNAGFTSPTRDEIAGALACCVMMSVVVRVTLGFPEI